MSVHDFCKRLESLQGEIPREWQVLDVRTREEHHYLGMIPGAMALPMHELPQRFTELDPDKETYLICQHGVRSLDAACYLDQLGFKKLTNLSEGMASWPGMLEKPSV
ncbi:MAG: rhodanese-like domain-containing protein [Cyanobacteria bacterium]|nr:rhodanese-like domain-containing protein [Cyanobacteriota bacterium]